jgi:DNA-binding response OmpR family regulator
MKMKFSVKAVEDGNAAVRAIEEQDYDLMYVPSSLFSLIITDEGN